MRINPQPPRSFIRSVKEMLIASEGKQQLRERLGNNEAGPSQEGAHTRAQRLSERIAEALEEGRLEFANGEQFYEVPRHVEADKEKPATVMETPSGSEGEDTWDLSSTSFWERHTV